MKKSTLTTILFTNIVALFLMTGFVFAGDWQPNGSDIYYNSGNVSIGNSTPQANLQVYGNGTIAELLIGEGKNIARGLLITKDGTSPYCANIYWSHHPTTEAGNLYFHASQDSGVLVTFQASGNVGIGTINPVQGSSGANPILHISGNGPGFRLEETDSGTGDWDILTNSGNIYFRDNNMGSSGTRLTIRQNGNIGIGTTSPNNKLDVCGTIRATEVKVETGWCDFVFEDNYNLRPLDEVETHIKEHKHLPDIPSAKEIKENGLPMAEMMTKQMQKIEELTLYMIEQNKRLKAVVKENAQLKTRVVELEKDR